MDTDTYHVVDPTKGDTYRCKLLMNGYTPFGGHNWRVLDVQGNHALILTENIIGSRAYHSTGGSVTWENNEVSNARIARNSAGSASWWWLRSP